MTNRLEVRPGEMREVDFNLFDAAYTSGIESCIAVATLAPDLRKGTLSHMRLIDSPVDLMLFLAHKAPIDSSVYIAGGWKRSGANQCQSDAYLRRLEGMLQEGCYSVKNSIKLLDPGRGLDITLLYNGVCVDMYQLIKTPQGFRRVPMGQHTWTA